MIYIYQDMTQAELGAAKWALCITESVVHMFLHTVVAMVLNIGWYGFLIGAAFPRIKSCT